MIQKVRSVLGGVKIILKSTFSDFKYNVKHFYIYRKGNQVAEFALLRQLCHMLDKGLNNPNFEAGHSLGIYNQAILLYNKCKNKFSNDSSFIWAGNILQKYENAQISGKPVLEDRSCFIYSEDQQIMLSEFIFGRTSCRNFTKRTISDDIIKKIVSIAVDAPNGCCRQTTRYYVTQTPVLIKNLSTNIAGITNFTNIQALVAVVAEASCYDLTDKNLQYVDAALSAENFILAASIYGIYGTMCNFFRANNAEIQDCKNILGIPERQNIVLFIAMGYPCQLPDKPKRQNIETFYSLVN